jgi:hypothetical protein
MLGYDGMISVDPNTTLSGGKIQTVWVNYIKLLVSNELLF